jgi:hypothetical protein
VIGSDWNIQGKMMVRVNLDGSIKSYTMQQVIATDTL